MRLTTVIFDLDDTLCDYSGAQRLAIARVDELLQEQGIADPAGFWADFRRTDPLLFAEFTDSRLPLDDYRRERFARPASRYLDQNPSAVRAFADRANEIYLATTNGEITMFDDAVPTLNQLRQAGLTVAVLTNGPSDGQRRKAAVLGLDRHLQGFFVSAELGFAKPDRRAFEAALHALDAEPATSLMVGDSPHVDVAGARAAGLAAVLLDRHGGAEDHSRITTLAEVPALIGLWAGA